MQGIFVSYRRQDSQSAAGRLSDHLRDHLQDVPIFRDVETIDPGVDFVEAINRALKSCAVLIAVIGPRWTNIKDAAGQRRLDDPNDYTRLEIATALTRKDVRVIPVLVESAKMPSTAELPDDLQSLARRNAIELSDKRWEYDVSQLVQTLRQVLGIREPDPAPPPSPEPPPKRGKTLKVVAATVAGLAILGAIDWEEVFDFSGEPIPMVPITPQVPAINNPVTAAPAVQINLTGMWTDSGGGQHRIVQQGSQIEIAGLSPEGAVYGTGGLQGNSGWMNYTLNGYPLTAQFSVSPDGSQLDAVVNDPGTGQRTPVRMWRTQ